MPALEEFALQHLQAWQASNLRRYAVPCIRGDGMRIQRKGRELVSFGSNDYLGLSHHPQVIAAMQEHLRCEGGAGSGASKLASGMHPLTLQIESQLATMKGTEAACVYGSGYLAGLGVLSAMAGREDLVIADKLVHASLLDGIQLSGATLRRYKHNDLQHCRELLEKNRQRYRHAIIVTETVFGMDGDLAPMAELHDLAKEYDAWLVTDDAHGFGVLENQQAGHHADVVLGTLSKAVGLYGGYACASETVIDWLRQAARPGLFSTALPPVLLAGIHASLNLLQQGGEELKERLHDNMRILTEALSLPQPPSAIVSVIFGEADDVMQAASQLEKAGFYVPAIRPPTVPPHTARLRITISAAHEPAMIESLAKSLRQMRTV